MKSFIFRILKDHYRSMPRMWSIVSHLLSLLVVIPFFRGFRPTEAQIGAALQAMSIYSALLFGILVPVGDQSRRLKDEIRLLGEGSSTEHKRKIDRLEEHMALSRDLLANVAFSIVISLTDVLLLMVALCLRPSDPKTTDPTIAAGPKVMECFWYLPTLILSAYLFVFLLLVLFAVIRTVYGSWLAEAKIPGETS